MPKWFRAHSDRILTEFCLNSVGILSVLSGLFAALDGLTQVLGKPFHAKMAQGPFRQNSDRILSEFCRNCVGAVGLTVFAALDGLKHVLIRSRRHSACVLGLGLVGESGSGFLPVPWVAFGGLLAIAIRMPCGRAWEAEDA